MFKPFTQEGSAPFKLLIKMTMLSVFISGFFYSCKKDDQPGGVQPTGIDIALVADNFVSPVLLVQAPGPAKSMYVVDQIGKIWKIDSSSKKSVTPFLDVSSKLAPLMGPYDERGLLGLAFHPDFEHNGKFFVFYTAPPRAGGPAPGSNWNSLTRVSQFSVSSNNTDVADANSEKVLLEADHPQFNHNGGTIAFGPDGFLYISIGDGGQGDDNAPGHVDDWYKVNAGGNAQNVEANLMGKVLRIDVNSGDPYSVPADNPYVGKPGLDEIYAFGFRNPYRFSFDMGGSHELISQDAGQSLYEEIDVVTKGGNYGWNVKEGTHCFSTDNDTVERASCPAVDSAGIKLTDPVVELNNAANPLGGIATTIIGGHTYRGSTIPELAGKYIFGVFSSDATGTPNAKIYSATTASSGKWNYDAISLKNNPDNLGMYLKGFGQSLDGEVYLMTTMEAGTTGNTGKVYKLIAAK